MNRPIAASLICVVLMVLRAPILTADESEISAVLDVFPAAVADVPAERMGKTDLTTSFSPSGSSWSEGLDETKVYLLEMSHQQDVGNSFKLRIGKGGQIYSLRGMFGESMPPSWRAEGSHLSPWNDEVWQFVAVCTSYNGVDGSRRAGEMPEETIERMKRSDYRSTFFIHNSGAYLPNNSSLQALYCPLLGFALDANNRRCRMVNWGLIPQVNSVHRSPILFYTQVRDVGDGIIELTWVVHNFSTDQRIVFDHLNAPWGGTRITSLPHRYVSSPEGKLLERSEILNDAGVVRVQNTGGWNLSAATEAEDSPSLALVFGRDRHLDDQRAREAAGEPFCQFAPSLYRDWRANEPAYQNAWKDWRTRPENSFRNYDVCEVIPKLRIRPQQSIWYRSFLVVGKKSKTIQLAKSLVDKVDYGRVRFDPAITSMRAVSITNGEVKSGMQAVAKPTFTVFSKPVDGTFPLFLIQHADTGRQIITTDPYFFVESEPVDFGFPADHPHHDYYQQARGYSMEAHHTKWQSLLGYGYRNKPATGDWKQLSKLVNPKAFPATDRFHLDLWVKPVSD